MPESSELAASAIAPKRDAPPARTPLYSSSGEKLPPLSAGELPAVGSGGLPLVAVSRQMTPDSPLAVASYGGLSVAPDGSLTVGGGTQGEASVVHGSLWDSLAEENSSRCDSGEAVEGVERSGAAGGVADGSVGSGDGAGGGVDGEGPLPPGALGLPPAPQGAHVGGVQRATSEDRRTNSLAVRRLEIRSPSERPNPFGWMQVRRGAGGAWPL